MSIVIAAVSVTVIGVVCAVVLAVASKFMAVKVDERVAQLAEIMPGVNCGACGYAGCDAYADALVNAGAPTNACAPGGNSLSASISGILGVEAEKSVVMYPVLYCSGDSTARQQRMDYGGINTCTAAKQLFGGQFACTFGCLGFGDCLAACSVNALCLDSGLPRVDKSLCIGCKLCQKACPNNILRMEEDAPVAVVGCSNIEKGAIVRKKCTAGCIACTKCVKTCPEQAISMVNNLAVIDLAKCTGCGECVGVCITKCIRLV